MRPYQLSYLLILLAGWSTMSHKLDSTTHFMVENCANALDDDGDGKIDINDPDCACPVLEPVSLIPNPSFEDMECCPNNRSQMNCASTWIQASMATTDYIHMCGWLGWDDFPVPQPFPDGQAIIGIRDGRVFQGDSEPGWKEYAGACLLSPLLAGKEYRFEFELGFVNRIKSPPIDITFFGTTDCENLPFGMSDQFFGCPTNGPGWQLLATRRVASEGGWMKTQLNVIPEENIYAIAIGPSCRDIITDTSLYYFFDNLVLADERAFEFVITGINHLCSPDFTMTVPFEASLAYQWYKEGIALVGEDQHELSKNYGEGNYQVRILGDRICNLTTPFNYRIPSFHTSVDLIICEGESYAFGRSHLSAPGHYVESFITPDNCDSTVSLNLEVQSLDGNFTSAKIFEGETYRIGNYRIRDKGEYLVTLMSSIGCDSLVQLDLEYYRVYFPNIFSPNKDGVNDLFEISGPDLISIEEFLVYDRWGTVLYSNVNQITDGSVGWDGSHNGELVNPGVYGYTVSVRMDDNVERKISGSVLLLR